jgi:hypothetical protein
MRLVVVFARRCRYDPKARLLGAGSNGTLRRMQAAAWPMRATERLSTGRVNPAQELCPGFPLRNLSSPQEVFDEVAVGEPYAEDVGRCPAGLWAFGVCVNFCACGDDATDQ